MGTELEEFVSTIDSIMNKHPSTKGLVIDRIRINLNKEGLISSEIYLQRTSDDVWNK